MFLFSCTTARCHVSPHPVQLFLCVFCVRELINNDRALTSSVSPHQDFRDAVAKATRQNGKPVVDERILSQILYYLPQLYQLNRDLLRELEERVAHW